ncbi:MAG: zinc transporter ZntB [Sphingomonas sp.]|jgi:zinc transporter
MTARSYIVANNAARAVTRDEATAALGTGGFVWVHFDDCDTETEEWLSGPGKLVDLIVSALVATETRPRMDAIDGGALVNLRGPDADIATNPDMLSSIRMWVAKGCVFTVTRRDLAALDAVEELVRDGKVLDPGDFVAMLASEITAELDPDVAELGDTLDDCEEMVGGRHALAVRQTIAKTRSRAIGYRRFMAPQRTALEKLAGFDVDWLEPDDRLHLGEAADRAARMVEELEAIRERSALLHEQLTDLRAELIDTRGLVISVVALVFLPLTFLTGLLGMNVSGIPFADEPWAFGAVVGVSIAIAIGVAWYFIRARWFR